MMADVAGMTQPEQLTFDQFCIESFRGLSGVNLFDLGSFNLLVGSGNSGKTSILEAIAIYCAPTSAGMWLTTARSREVRSPFAYYDSNQHVESISWLFPHSLSGLDQQVHQGCIDLSAEGTARIKRLSASSQPTKGTFSQVRLVEDENGETHEVDDAIEDVGIQVDIKCDILAPDLLDPVRTVSGKMEFWRFSNPSPRQAARMQTRIPCEFLVPYSHRNQPNQLRNLSQAVAGNEKSSLNELIKDLDNNIENVEIITDKEGSRPLIVLRHRKIGVAPIASFGDGLRRALTIALAIQQARNGVLLIDEIEAAMHISALDRIFPWLMRACKENNVQVFATTHSLEAVDAISKAVDEDASVSLVAYQLQNDRVKRYSANMLRRIVRERGLDIR